MRGKKVFCKSIENYKFNKNVKKYLHVFKKCGRGCFVRFVGVSEGVAKNVFSNLNWKY